MVEHAVALPILDYKSACVGVIPPQGFIYICDYAYPLQRQFFYEWLHIALTIGTCGLAEQGNGEECH